MIRYLVLPKIGMNMTEATIAEWYVGIGDRIEKEQMVLSAETDKSVQDIFATDSGILLKILADVGSDVKCQERIAVLGDEDDEYIEEEQSDIDKKELITGDTTDVKKSTGIQTNPEKSSCSRNIRISPKAKRIAKNNNIDVAELPAKDNGKRIVSSDVEYYIDMLEKGYISKDAFEPHSRLRTVIAKNMTNCILTKPKVTLNTSVDCGKLISYRQTVSQRKKVSYNDIIIKACAMALKDNPKLNAVTADGGLLYKGNINVGLAVDTDGGLLVPVLKNADKKDIFDISDELKVLVDKARSGKASIDDLTGGCITVSSLGAFGVESFDPIMNAPECFILGVGSMKKTVGVIDGNIGITTVMNICLSFDHAAFDGAKAAVLLKSIKNYLENPELFENSLKIEREEQKEKLSVAVLGGGPAGYTCAIRCAQLGASVTLIERDNVGGTCLNRGCMPTKALLRSAEAYNSTKCSYNIGVEAENVKLNFSAVQANRENVVSKLTGGVEALLKANRINKIFGEAKIKDASTISVNGEQLSYDRIVIATGSENVLPPISGVEEKCCINSTECLSLDEIPESLIVVGGGVVGIELGFAYASFGSKVTLLEMGDHILPEIDSEIVNVLENQLSKTLEIHTSSRVSKILYDGKKATVVSENSGNEEIFEGEKVLICAGRKPNTEGLNLEKLNIDNVNGFIKVNEFMETSVKNIYAVGDCTGECMYAHAAISMGEIAAGRIMGDARKFNKYECPVCAYVGPELASVGYTEEEAKRKGINVAVGKFPLTANGRSLVAGHTDGFIKMVIDTLNDRIIGVHMIGPNSADIIAQGAMAITEKMTVSELEKSIFCHPTVSEALRECALACKGKAIHIPNKKL